MGEVMCMEGVYVALPSLATQPYLTRTARPDSQARSAHDRPRSRGGSLRGAARRKGRLAV